MIADRPELAVLPAELREVVEAVYYRDLTIRQAAIELEITQHRVRTRLDLACEIMAAHPHVLVEDGEGI